VIGGLFGGAFGRAAQMLLPNSHIEPGAFALVAMGRFTAVSPHAAVVAGAGVRAGGQLRPAGPADARRGIAFVALRRRSLYRAQLPTQRDSPAHQRATLDVLRSTRVGA
jgi:CIC family chloride channel protein